MPILCPLAIRPISDDAFAEIDRVVMACAYASQNTLGRLCDERVYENDLAARLHAEGVADVHTQVPVTVSFDDFAKTYRLDLVVGQMIYELKTVAAFVAEHDAQAIHYAAMLGVDRVKLLNFRGAKGAGRLRRSPFAGKDRTRITSTAARWQALSERCEDLKKQMIAQLADWGAYLEVQLYDEGLIHFCGGEDACSSRVSVVRDGIELGTHRVHCHADGVAFIVTAITDSAEAYEDSIRRLLQFTGLKGMQWINLRHAAVEFVTLVNGKGMEARE